MSSVLCWFCVLRVTDILSGCFVCGLWSQWHPVETPSRPSLFSIILIKEEQASEIVSISHTHTLSLSLSLSPSPSVALSVYPVLSAGAWRAGEVQSWHRIQPESSGQLTDPVCACESSGAKASNWGECDFGFNEFLTGNPWWGGSCLGF